MSTKTGANTDDHVTSPTNSAVCMFDIPGEMIAHLQVTMFLPTLSQKCVSCTCGAIRSLNFPDDWAHQWFLEFSPSYNYRLNIHRTDDNKSTATVFFRLKPTKHSPRNIDYPASVYADWEGKLNDGNVRGMVVDVTIRVALEGDFAYLAEKRKTTFDDKRFQMLLSDQFKPDVTIVANDGQTAPAHWAVLAARSPFFSAMFNKGFKESVDNEIKLDLDHKAMEAMLAFIYTGQTDFTTVEIGKSLLTAGDMYFIKDLKMAAEGYLCAALTKENAIDLLAYGDRFKSPCLKRKALDVLLSLSFP